MAPSERTTRCGRGCSLDSRALQACTGTIRSRSGVSWQEARSREAVELARRLGDPATLGWALTARFLIVWGPDHLDEMVSLADEIVMIAEHAGAWDEVANGLAVRYEIHLTRGEVHEAQGDLERHIALAEELKLPFAVLAHCRPSGRAHVALGTVCRGCGLHRSGASARRGRALGRGDADGGPAALLLFLEQGGFEGGGVEDLGRRWNAWKPIVHRTGSVQPFSPGSIVNLGTSEKRRQGSTC